MLRGGVPDSAVGDADEQGDEIADVQSAGEQLHPSAGAEEVPGRKRAVEGLLPLLRGYQEGNL